MTPGHVITRQLNARRAFVMAFALLFMAICVLFVTLGSRALDQNSQNLTDRTSELPIDVEWDDEATEILGRIPWFARGNVRRSVEQSARADNVSLITRELLEEQRPGFVGER